MSDDELYLNINLSDCELKRMKDNHSYWEHNSEKFSSSHEVSWGDVNMMSLEIENILKYIYDGNYVLDVGCSNGYSTFKIAKGRKITVEAFDYSEKAINIAKRRQKKENMGENVKFSTGNVLNMDYPDNIFDIAYNIRVIINLPTWESQKKAILEIHRVLKGGGIYLFSEAFMGSLYRINALRELASMKPLRAHEFNLYIKEEELEKFVEPYFEIIAIKRFSSIYYVASRFLRYLTMKDSDEDSFSNVINDFFAKYKETENSGDFGIQKLYVLKKKGIF